MQSIFPDFIDPMLGAPFLGGGLGGMDPFGSFYLPGQQPSTRRRIEGVPVPPGTVGRDPNPMGSAGWTRSIPVDFIERENVYLVRADIPGVHKNEIHIDVHDKNVLRFGHNPMAEREKEDEEEAGVFHRAERVSSFRNRNLRMPENADLEGEIKAKYEDGVLEITVPKKPAEAVQGPSRAIAVE